MSDAYRQSALLLHSLGESDRKWILAQLAGDQRRHLSVQLTELSELGIPADRTLAEGLLARMRREGAISREDIAMHDGDVLRAAPAEVVLHLLNKEPTWLIAAVLSIEAWPWRETIFVGLDASKRDRVKQALGERPPAKLADALLRQLDKRLLDATSERRGLAPIESGWPLIRRQLKRLFRP